MKSDFCKVFTDMTGYLIIPMQPQYSSIKLLYPCTDSIML